MSDDGREQEIYLDHNATTPLDEQVLEAMEPFLRVAFGNAASVQHGYGRAAAEAVERARAEVADLLGVSPREIVFTSGATEANNLAIKGLALAATDRRHLVSCVTEHPAVLEPLAWLGRHGFEVDLEGDYVGRVSGRMAELFMGIVGSHPDFEAGVFTSVHIDDNFSIVVDTHGGRHLDTDFELNGASQRALTLSFIWALMEVSGTTVPRIIDTPLGMVSGGVKTRMVDSITMPSSGELPDFQVVLLMTRSEIRDIEGLLDERAGIVRTLSNSHHYPEDLVYSWHVDHPMSRLCSCTHRQSCRICARRYDERHGIEFRDMEATV